MNIFSQIFKSKPCKVTESEKALVCAREKLSAFVDMNFATHGMEMQEITSYWSETCDGVQQVECQLPTHSCTLLNVVMNAHTTIPRHWHAKQREVIFVVEGEIVDLENNIRTGTHGVYVIPPGTPHHIHTEKGALLNVAFVPKFKPNEPKPVNDD